MILLNLLIKTKTFHNKIYQIEKDIILIHKFLIIFC